MAADRKGTKNKQANKQTKPMLLSFLVALTLGHVPQKVKKRVWVKAGVVQCEFIPQLAPAECNTPPSLQSGVFYPNKIACVVTGLKTYRKLDKDLDDLRRRIKQKGRRTAHSDGSRPSDKGGRSSRP